MKKLFVLLFTLLFVFQSAHVLVYANSDITENDMIESQETVPSNNTTDTAKRTATAYFNCDTSRYLVTDTICATLHISQPLEDSQISYDNDGFTIEQVLKISDTSYSIQLKMQQVSAATLNVHLFNEEDVCASFSAISTDKGVFVSPISIHEAWRAYYYSGVEDNQYTISEFQKIMSDYALSLPNNSTNLSLRQTSTTAGDVSICGPVAPTPMIRISGNIVWQPYTSSPLTNPLANIYYEVYQINGTNETIMHYGYTSSSGTFSFSRQKTTETINLRLKIYARGKRFTIRDPQNIEYCFVLDKNNCSLNSNITLSAVINTWDGDSTSLTIETAQALAYGTEYVRAMQGSYLDTVSVVYPYIPTPTLSVSHYSPDLVSIFLLADDYNNWDTILHEHGHHIQYQLGIDSSEGGERHEIKSDLMDYNSTYTKTTAIHVAWMEALATMFSELSQIYCSASLNFDLGVADATYNLFDFESAKYNNTDVAKGEACEGRIIALLWDIYDTDALNSNQEDTEVFDSLSMGNIDMWNLLTHQIEGFEDVVVETLSDFCSYFLDVYPESLENFSALLSHHGIAPSNMAITEHADGSQTISWTANGMSQLPNNYFAVAIVDNTTAEALYQVVTTNCNILLSSSMVNNLETHSCHILIIAYQLNDLIDTGPYYYYCNIT